MAKISLPPETVFEIGNFSISNAMFSTFLTSVILIIFAIFVRKNAGIVPSRMQVMFEMIMEFIWDKMVIAFGDESRARKFFPLLFTIFLFLLIANQFTLIPFVESIFVGDVNLFRTPTSHYSLPIVFTVFVLILAHILAFAMHPIKHIGNYIKIGQFFKLKSIKELPMAILDFLLGLLDIVGEFAKLASLSTRLFGNMFAGSIIVAIISGLTFLTQFFVPIPFLLLGILSGLVQAFVFTMLSAVFISSSLNGVKPINNNS